ncbi:hypothetical protein ES703_62790 [subsurface metagenome]
MIVHYDGCLVPCGSELNALGCNRVLSVGIVAAGVKFECSVGVPACGIADSDVEFC